MPELPDILAYVEALEKRIDEATLKSVRIINPFVLRTARPPIVDLNGRRVRSLRRIGKRVAVEFDGGIWLVIHLMIGGRLHWASPGTKPTGRNALAHFIFSTGQLTLTEAGSKHRASIHVLEGEDALTAVDPGGLEVADATLPQFVAALRKENHTLKRALTDPHLFSGIGNAYSDEILHAARLSPVSLTRNMSDEEAARLFEASRTVLNDWTARLRAEAGGEFPSRVTAFRAEMAVHGKFGQPCPVCGTAIQRIRYAENEANYCPRCQTGGRLLADRSLSRLLKSDWPRSIDEAEQRQFGLGVAKPQMSTGSTATDLKRGHRA
ncbi:MAG TPA: DNA-formamidopyrimidine glycosylase family protein [Opitutaceae bacterium]